VKPEALATETTLCEVTVPAADVPEELTDVACKLTYFVSPDVVSVRRPSPERFQIFLSLSDEGRSQAVARDVRTLLDRLSRGYRPHRLRRLFGGEEETATVSAGGTDLTERLIEQGWVRRHDAGLWALRPPFLGLMEAIDDQLQELARDVYGAPAHSFPALIATETLHRAGFISSFPQNVGFVSHLHQNLDALVRFQEASASGGPAFPSEGELAPPEECLPPAVCYHRFRDLAEQTLASGSVVTARGTCFRYEARHNMRSLVRLWSFQMREIIYMGDEAYVRGMAEQGPAVLEGLLSSLGIAGSCESATDPFFVNVFGPLRYAQVAGELKFKLRLPLGGGESLAAASLNLHQDHFAKAFAIGLPGGVPATSGCTAFGLERLTLGFLAQHGLDDGHWPDGVASRAKHHVVSG
jgi:seryl-tRNA synthetase